MPKTPTPELSWDAAGGLEKVFEPLPFPELPVGVAEPLFAEALAVSERLVDAAPVAAVAEDVLPAPVEGFADDVVENEDDVADLVSVADEAGRAASVALLEKLEPDGLDAVAEAFEAKPEVGVVPALDGFDSTFAGFRSIVTGRLGTPVPAAVVDAVPSPVSDDLPSPEDAVPDGEDLPPEGSLSDAM